MTVLPRGRGGWVANRLGHGRAVLVAAAALALALAGGCSSQKAAQPGQGAGGGAGMGESGVGAGGGSSLSQFQKGMLGQGGQGPLSDIHFDYNDYSIRPQDGEILKTNAGWLTQHPQSRVQIEGHCDNRGSEEYNLALGAKRAQAAKDYLETLGVAADRMSTISYGKELPLCTEDTDDCWAQNRRDHFVVGQ